MGKLLFYKKICKLFGGIDTESMYIVFRDDLVCNEYCEKVCVYDEHPKAGRDKQYWAPDSRSKYKTPFDEIIK